MRTSLAFKHKNLISYSSNWTGLPGLCPLTAKGRESSKGTRGGGGIWKGGRTQRWAMEEWMAWLDCSFGMNAFYHFHPSHPINRWNGMVSYLWICHPFPSLVPQDWPSSNLSIMLSKSTSGCWAWPACEFIYDISVAQINPELPWH